MSCQLRITKFDRQAVITNWVRYYKVWQIVIIECVRYCIWDRLYYKVRKVLQSVTVTTKWDVTLVQTTRNSVSFFDYSFKYFQIFYVFYMVGHRIPDFGRINLVIFFAPKVTWFLMEILRLVCIYPSLLEVFILNILLVKLEFKYIEFLTLKFPSLSFIPPLVNTSL